MNKIFWDVDGVHADWNGRAFDVFGEPASSAEARLGKKDFWKQIRDYRQPGTGHGFFRSLDLLPGAEDMWERTKHLSPFLLTGCPFGNWAPPQKVEWAMAVYSTENIITCMARDKCLHITTPGDILVDDNDKFRHLWEAAGGVFVHHVDVNKTMDTLHTLHPEWF